MRKVLVNIAELAIPVLFTVIAGTRVLHELGAVWYIIFLAVVLVWFIRFGHISADAAVMPLYRSLAAVSLRIAKLAVGKDELEKMLEKDIEGSKFTITEPTPEGPPPGKSSPY
jgi:hypothetical protein